MENFYVITGANGFLGNVVIRRLNERGIGKKSIYALVHGEAPFPSLAGLSCEQIQCDITKEDDIKRCFDLSGCICAETRVCVIHCAGVIDIGGKKNDLVRRVDVGGTKNVIDAVGVLCSTLSIRPFMVHIGSVHAIPKVPLGTPITEPDSFDQNKVSGQYAKAKAQACAYVKKAIETGLIDGCIVLPSGIIGPYDFSPESMKRVVSLTMHEKMPIIVEGGYDFVDVRDVADGIIAACSCAASGGIYLLSGHYTTIRGLCEIVAAAANVRSPSLVVSLRLARVVAPLFEFYYRKRKKIPLFTRYALEVLDSNGDFTCALAEAELGYARRPLQQTLTDMVEWLHSEE